MCYADITTGEINVTTISHNISKAVSEIVSIGMKEIVVTSKVDKTITDLLSKQFKITVSINDEISEEENYKYIYNDLNDIRYIEAIKLLLTYISKTQKRELSHFQKAVIKENKNYLKMDIHTKRNLELTETLRLKQR